MTALTPGFWRGKRILITGHTGFKGSWAALWLAGMGAEVTGLSLPATGHESLFRLADVAREITSIEADIRNAEELRRHVADCRPQIVLHLAAQALVRASYSDPVGTWQTNVIGTLNLLEALKATGTKAQVLIVTSDKVYLNDETGRAFTETAALGGHDPYSASKAACEILTASWRDSFAKDANLSIATARAGNVIGGGDFSEDRLVPDIWRAIREDKILQIRNPDATRPWQHVLDCLHGYLLYIEKGAGTPSLPRALNFGPATAVSRTVGEIAGELLATIKPGVSWALDKGSGPREMDKLSIDSTLARTTLDWRDHLAGGALGRWTAEWYRAYDSGADMRTFSLEQITAFMNETGKQA